MISSGATCQAFLTAIGGTTVGPFNDDTCYVGSATVPNDATVIVADPYTLRPQYDSDPAPPILTNNGTIDIKSNGRTSSSVGFYQAGKTVNNGTFQVEGAARFSLSFVNNGKLVVSGQVSVDSGTLDNRNGTITCTGTGIIGAFDGTILGNLPANCDGIAPLVTASATTADGKPYTAGTWTNQTVTVHYTCTDQGSGVQFCSPDDVRANDTTPLTFTLGRVLDNNNNIDTVSFGPVLVDKTPPTITASATTADGKAYTAGTWTNQTVTVHFTCADTGSGIAACPVDQVFAADGVVTATGTTPDRAGNTATAEFGPIKVDKTAPVVTASAVTANGQSYTYGTPTNQDVTVSFACTETGSGLQSGCPVPVVASGEGTSSGGLGSVDLAGNPWQVSWGPIVIDKTPPTVTVTATNADGTAYTPGAVTAQNVTVHYTCADGSSGVVSCPADDVVTAGGTTNLAHTVTDKAGNATPVSFAVVIVRTPPTVTCGAADGLWHATDVTISCTASDAAVGLADPADASFTLTTSVPAGTETANAATNSRTVTNKVGLSTVAGPITGNKVDKLAPSIVITTPPANGVYLLNQAVTAGYACRDGGSGVATCAGPVANGARVDTASVGAKTFTVNAADQVGNKASLSNSYQVGYQFAGFFRPVANPPAVNNGQAGQEFPLKWQLKDANGVVIKAPSTYRSLTYQKTACPGTTGAPGPVTAITSKLEIEDGQFKVEWKSPKVVGCYSVTLTLDSGQTFQSLFNLKK